MLAHSYLCLIILIIASLAAGQEKTEPIQHEAKFTDGSVLKIQIRDERLEFATAYGKLLIPVSEIRRIEFGLRIPADVSKLIDSAIINLGDKQFGRREQASAILLGLREKAFPAVQKAVKHEDMEIANRADELIKKFKEQLPSALLESREFDVIQTVDSKIQGRLETATLNVRTSQFGDVVVKLSDVLSMQTKISDPEIDNALPAPLNMIQYRSDFGKSFVFRVTAALGGGVWGNEPYTSDSSLATAVVHAGLLTPGQSGVIRVRMMPPPPFFPGATRNGVTSTAFGSDPAAYQLQLLSGGVK